MSRPFTVYPGALDADELGYWRFGENAGRLTPVGAGPTFTNVGTEAGQDGRRFVHTNPDYMVAPFTGLPQREQVTLEAWVRDWGAPIDASGMVAILCRFADPDNRLDIGAVRTTDPASSYIRTRLMVDGAWAGWSQWTGADADAVLASPEPWHVAAVLASPSRFTLYVNGVIRLEDTTDIVPMLAGNYLLILGTYLNYATWPLSAVLDEVRFSKTARYSANFPVTRYGEGQRALVRGPEARAGLFAGVLG